jgi:hypothetical protein
VTLTTVVEKIGPGYAALRRAARTFDDIQHERILIGNRIVHDEDPTAAAVKDALLEAEQRARKWIETVYKSVAPEGVLKWQEATPGISGYQLGRLLGEAGHPRLAMPYRQIENPDFDPEQPQSADNEKRLAVPLDPYLRSVSQWWQRCGHGAPGRAPKGASQEDMLKLGLPKAKVVVHLMVESCFKLTGQPDKNGQARALSPYRVVADEAKAKYAERVHTGPCSGGWVSAGQRVVFAKCKIDGDRHAVSGSKFDHYAEAGDPFSPAHIHAIGLRHAGKAMLADLYDAAQEDWTA